MAFPETILRAPESAEQMLDVQQVRIVGDPTPRVLREAMRLAALACSYELDHLFEFVSLQEVIVECMRPPWTIKCLTSPDDLLVIYVIPVPPPKRDEILRRMREANVPLRVTALLDEGVMLIGDLAAPTEGADQVLDMVRAVAAAP